MRSLALAVLVLSACKVGAVTGAGSADGAPPRDRDGGGDHDGGGGDGSTSMPFMPSQLELLAGSPSVTGEHDGVGMQASFSAPGPIAFDGSDALYVADGTGTIRKLVLSTNTVTTLAGTPGVYGHADGKGAAASFQNNIQGIALDDSGNLYIGDTSNYTVRKLVLSTGQVTTLAGTAGVSGKPDGSDANLYLPKGLAYDGAGHLFVADIAVVRKITLSSAAMTAIAVGNQFTVENLASDGAGNLYLASTGNGIIKKLVVASSTVTSFAGNLTPGTSDGVGVAASFTSIFALAIDTTNNLYALDAQDNNSKFVLRKIVLSSAGVTSYTGDSAALGASQGLAYDGAGNLYMSSLGSSTISKIAVGSGGVSVLPLGSPYGNGNVDGTGAAAQFRSPAGLALDENGDLYVADEGNGTIRQAVVATGAVTTVGSAVSPYGIAYDGAGSVFVSTDETIRKLDLATHAFTIVAGTYGSIGTTDGTGAAARFTTPAGIYLDRAAGDLYVADTYANTVRKVVVATGEVTTIAGTPSMTGGYADGVGAAARFNRPGAVIGDGSGTLYVADSANAVVRKIVTQTNAVTTIAGTALRMGGTDGPGTTALFSHPIALALDGATTLYVADDVGSAIRAIDLPSGVVTTLLGELGDAKTQTGPIASARVQAPDGLAYGAGALYISSQQSVLVLR